ncbi:RDD family protein [Peterkaempfera bronchialis]|nr:RDD family protein [Peterkaempfera bronchialis]
MTDRPSSGTTAGAPTPGYYPDPSIPGFVRYWDGRGWAPGTSRPEPGPGEVLAPPRVVARRSAPSMRSVPPPVAPGAAEAPEEPAPARGWAGPARLDESGPVFFDETTGGTSFTTEPWTGAAAAGPPPREAEQPPPAALPAPAARPALPAGPLPPYAPASPLPPHPAPPSPWATPSHPAARTAPERSAAPTGPTARSSTAAALPPAPAAPADPGFAAPGYAGSPGPAASDESGYAGSPGPGPGSSGFAASPGSAEPGYEGSPAAAASDQRQSAASSAPGAPGYSEPADPGSGSSAFGASPGYSEPPDPGSGSSPFGASPAYTGSAAAPTGSAWSPAAPDTEPPAATPSTPSAPPASPDDRERSSGWQVDAHSQRGLMESQAAPRWVSWGVADGEPEARQTATPARRPAPGTAHRTPAVTPTAEPPAPQTARTAQPPRPDRTAAEPTRRPQPTAARAAARRKARPAGYGRRLAARVVDSLVVAALAAAVGIPLAASAMDHIQEKIDAARDSGRSVRVWLIDPTVLGKLGLFLLVLLLIGFLYEVLPTARWGRTPGKRLARVRVLDTKSQRPPGLGGAVRRWLAQQLLAGMLLGGLLDTLWCLFDRPLRQCWHDKAGGTFVAADD